MHPVQSPPGLLTLALAAIAVASPYPRDSLRDLGFGYLKDEQCSEYCGVNNEICCSNDESCYTSSGVASCTTVPELDKRAYTTTWTETLTFTSVISSWYVPTTTAGTGTNGEDCVPPEGSGEIACGEICCATWQYCAYKGQCLANPGYSTWTEITTTGVVVTTQYSAPWRPTSGVATVTATTTTDTTGTLASETTTPTSSMGNGTVASTSPSLSPGAIAGIVVGSLIGVVLLLLLCFCCIVRGLWGAFAGILGLGKKKNRDSERVEIIEERYSRHGSAAAATARPTHRTWFGGGGGRPSAAASRKEKKSGGGLGWIAAGAGAAALLLGLRRSEKQKKEAAASHRSRSRSDWSSSYYTDSYTATSPSSFSSDARTRRSGRTQRSGQSRRSRQSRGTRSRTSRPSRV